MKVYRAYKTELDPTRQQRMALLKHAGCARFTWNWALAQRMAEYKATGKSPNAMTQHKQLVKLKRSDWPWMYEVSKWAAEGSLQNLDAAFKAFFRRCKSGQKPGYPKFKSKNRGVGSFTLRGCIHVLSRSVVLPRIGEVKLKERGYIPTKGIKILAATVSERAGRWFVSVQCEQDIAVPENRGSVIGVDLGIKHFMVTSEGVTVDAPKPLKKALKKLRRVSRQHSRKKKGSKNRRKAARRLARMHYRIACIRKDFLHKVTTALAKNHSEIAIEDLAVQGMLKNRKLARAIADLGWAESRRQLEYKCPWYGSALRVINRFEPTSKRCSVCGHVKERLALSERVFRCEACGHVQDRDLNAARNVAASSAETQNACGAGIRKRPAAKQEPGLFDAATAA